MLPLDHPDRIRITFDDHRLVANARLILPTTLPRHLFAWLPHLTPSTFVSIKLSPSLSIASHPLSHPHGYIPSVDSG